MFKIYTRFLAYHTLWRRTYMYSLYEGFPLPRNVLVRETNIICFPALYGQKLIFTLHLSLVRIVLVKIIINNKRDSSLLMHQKKYQNLGETGRNR